MKKINYAALMNYLEREANMAETEYKANMNSASDAAPYYKGWQDATAHILATLQQHSEANDQ